MSAWAERVARAGLSRCVEGEDAVAGVALGTLGASRLWALVRAGKVNAEEEALLQAELVLMGHTRRGVVPRALERWRARASACEPERELEGAARRGWGFLIPGDPTWPAGLNDLGPRAPWGLWTRGARIPAPLPRSVAVVGTRDPSGYGVQNAWTLASELASAGLCIVSGGALGIDATAHRAAIALHRGRGAAAQEELAATVVVLAGGIDRLYPQANAELLSEAAREHCVVSEHAPGAQPTKWRFLARNRLIAALCAGTVVVEGRWRSGASSTAHAAAELGRWVGAVPGPVTLPTCEAPHRLIREGAAELVSAPSDVLEALSPRGDACPSARAEVEPPALDEAERRMHDVLHPRRDSDVDVLLTLAGLSATEGLAALNRLFGRGLARRSEGGGWRRANGTSPTLGG